MKSNIMKSMKQIVRRLPVLILGMPVVLMLGSCSGEKEISMASQDDIYGTSQSRFRQEVQSSIPSGEPTGVAGEDVSVVKVYEVDTDSMPLESSRRFGGFDPSVSFGLSMGVGYGTYPCYFPSYDPFNPYSYYGGPFCSPYDIYSMRYNPFYPYYYGRYFNYYRPYYPGYYPGYGGGYPIEIPGSKPASRVYPSKFYTDRNNNYYLVNSSGRRYYIVNNPGKSSGRNSGDKGKSRYKTTRNGRATNSGYDTRSYRGSDYPSGRSGTVSPARGSSGSSRSSGGSGGSYSGKRPR